jgi:hypothetical protein
MEGLTETRFIKYSFTDKELLDLSRKMARAENLIGEKADTLKSVAATIKAEIAEQEGVLHSCAEKLRSGYEMRQIDCDLKYEDGLAKYYSKDTGELVEERPMTSTEQLRLTSKSVDAEQIIRQSHKEEETGDTEE